MLHIAHPNESSTRPNVPEISSKTLPPVSVLCNSCMMRSPSWRFTRYWVNTCFVLLCACATSHSLCAPPLCVWSPGTCGCSPRTTGARWPLDRLFQDMFPIDFYSWGCCRRNSGRGWEYERWGVRERAINVFLTANKKPLKDLHAIWEAVLIKRTKEMLSCSVLQTLSHLSTIKTTL